MNISRRAVLTAISAAALRRRNVKRPRTGSRSLAYSAQYSDRTWTSSKRKASPACNSGWTRTRWTTRRLRPSRTRSNAPASTSPRSLSTATISIRIPPSARSRTSTPSMHRAMRQARHSEYRRPVRHDQGQAAAGAGGRDRPRLQREVLPGLREEQSSHSLGAVCRRSEHRDRPGRLGGAVQGVRQQPACRPAVRSVASGVAVHGSGCRLRAISWTRSTTCT